MSAKTVALGSIATITSGGTPDRKTASYWNGDIPWVKTAQIQNGSIAAQDIDECITPLGLKESSARIIPSGTILMAMYGQGKTRGQVAILGIDAAINQACAAILLKDSADRDYVYQQLLFRYKAIRALSNTGSQENLNAELIREIAFPLPAHPEQRRMARVLRDWDTAIERGERLILARKQALAFHRQRLFRSSCSHSWSLTKLSVVLTEHGSLCQGAAPVFSVSVHKGLVDQLEHLGRSFAASDTCNYNLVHPGDVVYTKSPTGDFPYGVVKQSHAKQPVIVSPLYGVFTPSSPDIGLLIDFFFESPIQSRNYLRPLIQRGAKNTIAISNAGFLSGTVRLPRTKAAEHEAAAFVRDAKSELGILAEQMAALRRQKWGLMQKLLRDELKVPVDQGIAA